MRILDKKIVSRKVDIPISKLNGVVMVKYIRHFPLRLSRDLIAIYFYKILNELTSDKLLILFYKEKNVLKNEEKCM